MVLAIGVVFTLVKGDISANLLQLLQVVFGAFVVGNVGEHIANGVVARSATAPVKDDSPTPPPSTDPAMVEALANTLNGMQEALVRQEQAMAVSQQALSAIMKKAGITK